ncbi:hypothetical protein ACLGI4_16165 [Streptomyces sp. HMX112]|uniref:hypothetical protein n=1 Tax=Streptomyces sp. HMX112 TaxID=3390850 RepID=UPI003A806993
MYLAGLPDTATEWGWMLGALALYVVVGFALEYRARRRRGSARPAKEALRDLDDREWPQSPEQYLTSRMVLLGGMLAMVPVALVTSGTVRQVALVVVGAAAVAVWAYYDHRTEKRSSADRG